ncbi:MAG TPA: NlpC/P60 family protein [Scandinavium sp.]|jgi:lipoprotein Spr
MYLTKLLASTLFCVTTLTVNYAYASHTPSGLTPSKSPARIATPSITMQSKIYQKYSRWKGTRYRFGGHSHRGIDCSALMQELVSTSLPRTAGEQMRRGHHIAKGRLKPGDLVFFKTSPKTQHVGVYVGNNEFIHASRNKGVTISSMANGFWKSHYQTSRRILADT